MERICVIGDMHTVSAFRLCGADGVTAVREDAAAKLEEIVRRGDAAIVAVTNDLADELAERIGEINRTLPLPVIIAIPGIDDARGIRRPVAGYIAEALGIAL